MNKRNHLELARDRYLIAGFGLAMIGLEAAILASPRVNFDGALDWLSGSVLAILAIIMIWPLSHDSRGRIEHFAWAAGLAPIILVAIVGLATPFLGNSWLPPRVEAWDDALLWLAVLIGLIAMVRMERGHRFIRSLLAMGFGVHSVAILAEAGAGGFAQWANLDRQSIEAFFQLSEFVFLQAYVAGFSLILLDVIRSPAETNANNSAIDTGIPHGTLARQLFHRFRLFRRPHFPKYRLFHLPGGMLIFNIGSIAYCVPRLGKRVRAQFGKSIGAQMRDILFLMMKHGLNARDYYNFELYFVDSISVAGAYLSRYETKNGLFGWLNRMLPPAQGKRSNLGDKLAFAEICRRHGVPTAAIVATAEAGFSAWMEGDDPCFSTGVFVKPRQGKGAKGVAAFGKTGIDSFTASDGKQLNARALRAYIAGRSIHGPMIAQERLENAPEIADLADQSLVVVRVITFLDPAGHPIVTHGMLRVLCKLEPGWPIDDELGAPIDLDTGRLGQLASDRVPHALDFLDTHPVTGAQVRGRVLSCWEEVKSVALAAHALCLDRAIVGWDLAATPDGVRLIEGNAIPDVAFLEHAHRAPLGVGPMGPLLGARLTQLAEWLSHQPKGRAWREARYR